TYSVPRICFINKMDRTGASFWRTVDMIRDRLGADPLPIQLPLGVEAEFRGVIDLLRRKALVWSEEAADAPPVEEEIPESMVAEVEKWREHLVERVVELDDELLHEYLEGNEVSDEAIERALRHATIEAKLVPILCGSALKNKGVQPLLDAVVQYLPSPLDRPPVA